MDSLRILATVAIVLLHVASSGWLTADIHTASWIILTVYNSLSRWAVPVFIMISGAIFLCRDFSIKTIYRKNILRLLTAFLFWSLLYALVQGGSILDIIVNTITGKYYLWFIPMMIGLYICLPFLRPIAANGQVTKYYLLVSTIACFAVPQALTIVEQLIGGRLGVAAQALQSQVTALRLDQILGYPCYFLLGHYLTQRELSKKARTWIYALGVIGAISTVLLTVLTSWRLGVADTTHFQNFTVNVLFMSLAIFTFFQHRSAAKGSGKLLSTVSNCCFGVYLVHMMLISIIRDYLHIDALSFPVILSVPVIGLAVFAAALTISWIIHQIPILKKYIV